MRRMMLSLNNANGLSREHGSQAEDREMSGKPILTVDITIFSLKMISALISNYRF